MNIRKSQVIDFLENHFRQEGALPQATMYRMLPRREQAQSDPIAPPALVEVETRGTRSLILLVPGGGGHVFRLEDRPIQVMTAQSPLGSALLGRKLGDTIEVEIAGGSRSYRILDVT
jgi:hypothetical protein